MRCNCCGRQLEYGELYYDINGESLCEDCMRDNYELECHEMPEKEKDEDPRDEPEYWEER